MFVKQGFLNSLGRVNRWKRLRIDKWYRLPGAGSEEGIQPELREEELLKLAFVLNVELEQLLKMIIAELSKRKAVLAVRCRDGVLVHPEALALVMSRILKKTTKQDRLRGYED